MLNAMMKLAQDSAQSLSQAATAPLPVMPAMIPSQRLGAYQQVMGSMLNRQMALTRSMLAATLSPAPDFSWFIQAAQMQQAVFDKFSALQIQAFKELADIANGAASVGQANTLSKLMDQEFDLQSRLHDVFSSQMTALAGLMESVQIGYGYLLAQHLTPPTE